VVVAIVLTFDILCAAIAYQNWHTAKLFCNSPTWSFWFSLWLLNREWNKRHAYKVQHDYRPRDEWFL